MSDASFPTALFTPLSRMPEITVLDVFAVAWLLFLVMGMSWYVDSGPRAKESASG